MQGFSLRALAAELRDGGVPTVTGADWSAETLREILLRPRNAGFMVTSDPLAAVINAPDPVAAWNGLGLVDQRLFIDRSCW